MGEALRRADGCVCDPTYEDYPLTRCPVHETAGPAVREWQGVRWLDLAAPLSLSPEAIDRAARLLAEHAVEDYGAPPPHWEECDESDRDHWRGIARAVVAELTRDGT